MKILKLLLVILTIAGYQYISAQGVGIKTIDPKSTFHVDAAGNNDGSSAPTRYDDDVFIYTDGSVGVGTGFATPLSKLEVKGKFQLLSGNHAAGKVLVSDANGLADWKMSTFNSMSVWEMKYSGDGQTLTSTTPVRLTGQSSITQSGISGLSATMNGVIVPAGKYIILVTGKVYSQTATTSATSARSNIVAYGRLAITSTTGPTEVFTIFSQEAPGATFTYEAATSQTLYLTYAVRSGYFSRHAIPPHYNAYFKYTLTFIKL